MSSTRIVPRALAVLTLALAIVTPDADVFAQAAPDLSPPGAYQEITNFSGFGAGTLFRLATNKRLSGAQPVSPTINNVAFANLPKEQDGMLVGVSAIRDRVGAVRTGVRGSEQTAARLISPSLLGTNSPAGVAVSGPIFDTDSPASVSKLNFNGIYNVRRYGAKGDGVTHGIDAESAQAAIDAACAAGVPATIYWPTPAPSGFYLNDKPLFIHCSGLKLQGPGMGTNNLQIIHQDPNYPSGPVFVFQQETMPGVTLGAPLISGSTNSASFTGKTKPYYINLNDASNVTMGLNGARAATIDAYVKLTSTVTGTIVCSNGAKDSAVGTTRAFCLRINDSAQFYGNMTVNGVSYTLTDTTTILAAGKVYDEQLTYDGTTIRLFTNGSLVASSAHSGTITQPYWETVTIGGGVFPGNFPEDGADNINGSIDGVQISKTARHTSNFTPCDCEPTNDSNTIVIASFDKNLKMLTQLQWQDVGVHQGWSYVRRMSNAGIFGIEMDGISVVGLKGSIAIIGQQFFGCHIRYSSFVGMTSGIWEFTTDFENTFDDLYISGSYIDFYVGGQSGLQFLTGGINLVGGLVGLRAQDSSIMAQGVVVQQQAGMIWGYSIQGDTGTDYFACDGCGLDAELADARWMGTLQLDNLEVLSWTGGALAAIGSSPVVEIDGGSQHGSAVFTGVNFSPTSASPEIFHVTKSNLPGVATVINPHLGAAAPWTDSPRDVVIVIGSSTTGIISSITGGMSTLTPTISSCGAGANVAPGGTSNAFVLKVGSTDPTTICAVSFGSEANFANRPVCTGQDITQGFTLKQSALSTSGITFTAPSGVSDMHGDTINVQCIGK